MKLIDDKGKLFGLINIIDLLVILAVLLVAGGAYYKLKMQSGGQGAAKTVTVTVIAPGIRPEMLTNVKVGDKMVSGDSFTNFVIKKVEIKPAYMISVDSAGQRVASYDPYLKDLFVTLEGKTVISGGTIRLGGQDIKSNKEFFVKSLDYELKGLVMTVDIEK
ncbi:DUF4330 domain-containing protein [Pelotomaculum propionicicum]|uniref:DUF4330 domain-containing protein n=1 Tax=Pelotomaculum propionicicum TaxID=258475 RepID=A0A4Y7RJS6_9FIRM|nr:DUF4330 domain-containing protein [Pelotomaculum propionicicum]NLI13106.1 DUF4330 domain-containing protein [Peptococcaceae bacterium]TEB08989.1 hypothetical protein Pmgp_03481 [Pelotomaculum propionicicum]